MNWNAIVSAQQSSAFRSARINSVTTDNWDQENANRVEARKEIRVTNKEISKGILLWQHESKASKKGEELECYMLLAKLS